MPGQARLSGWQSPLVHGRFSFQDEVGGSSPPRPTIRHLTSGNSHPFVSGPKESLVSDHVRRSCVLVSLRTRLTSKFSGFSGLFLSCLARRIAVVERITTPDRLPQPAWWSADDKRTPRAKAPERRLLQRRQMCRLRPVLNQPIRCLADPMSSGGSTMGRLSSHSRPTGLGRRAGRAGPGGTPATLGG